ncbi:MAG: HprK-related kinase A [Sedimenticola sp.]|nr:HprK-related kinase A [Sedimenticola sp.]
MTNTIGALPFEQFSNFLKSEGIRIETGPFVTRLRTKLTDVIENLALLYSDYPAFTQAGFSDFHLDIHKPASIRRWIQPQVNFTFDELTPFKPLPRPQAYAIFEWGLNWCISNYAHQYLIIHSAVLEKNDAAIVLPGVPGAGKSTLCAGLALSGWRLFSDEMALIDPSSGQLVSSPRPISLKNESINIIRNFSSSAVFGITINDTTKGSIAHLKVPEQSIQLCNQKALPKIIAFPRYRKGASTSLTPLSKSRAFMTLCENSFNYTIQGKNGFSTVKTLIDNCDCFEFEYSSLEDAIRTFDTLIEQIQ